MEIAKLIPEYLKILLSPQVIAGVAIMIALYVFREDVRALFRRIARIRLPGGSELFTPQAERASDDAPDGEVKSPIGPLDQAPLPRDLSLTPEQTGPIREILLAERAKAYLWEYRYLYYFLMPHTQRVLDWLASIRDRPTYSLYDAVWTPAIPNPGERKAVIYALASHHLVQHQGELLEVTPKGKEYIQWRGPVKSGEN